MKFIKISPLLYRKNNWLVLIISIIVYIIAGNLSSYLWKKQEYAINLNVLLPGLIFTGASIFIFVLNRIECKPEKWLTFYITMCFTYMIVYSVTLMTAWIYFLAGIFTGGVGALATFMLMDSLIIKIAFSKKKIFIWGSLAFVIHDIFLIQPLDKWVEHLSAYPFMGMPADFYGNVIWLWQVIVGTKLALTIHAKKKAVFK